MGLIKSCKHQSNVDCTHQENCDKCGWNPDVAKKRILGRKIKRKLRIKLDRRAYMPERSHDTDAGLDLRAREDAIVPAGGSFVFDTGVHLELPETIFEGCVTAGFLKSKSGLNVNHNITSDGVIDKGYTGSIHVKLYNNGTEDYHVKRGDKISQLVIMPIFTPALEQVDELDETERGDGGFGSTER